MILRIATTLRSASIGSTTRPSCFWPILLGSLSKRATTWNPRVLNPRYRSNAAAQISQTDQRQRPVVVDAKNVPERTDQLFDRVPNTGMPELAEKSEILPNLGVLDRERLTELAARNRLLTLPLISFELPQVKAHPADNGLGRHLHSRRLALRVAHLRASKAESWVALQGTPNQTRFEKCMHLYERL